MPTEQCLIYVSGRELLNALPATAALMAPDGEIKAINRAWLEFGQENGLRLPNHGLKSNFFEVCNATQGPDREISLEAARGVRELTKGLRTNFSIQYPCHSPSERRWCLLTATRIGRQTPSPVLMLHEDVTSWVLNQERLQGINAELARVAAFISHDFQAPLHTIQGCVELIRDNLGTVIEQSTNRYVDVVSETTKRLTTFATEVLNFALVGNQQEVPMEMLDLSFVVHEALQNIDQLIREYEAAVSVDQLGVAVGNRVYLVQLFQNLISNAIIHSGRRARVHIGVSWKENQTVYFVQDFGPGMPKEVQEKLFQPFSCQHQTEKTGAGLGLAICRHVVEQHGGRISVESSPGCGSTFYFSLREENAAVRLGRAAAASA